jgi:hypothetical protein
VAKGVFSHGGQTYRFVPNANPSAVPKEVWLQGKSDNVVVTPTGQLVIIDPF